MQALGLLLTHDVQGNVQDTQVELAAKKFPGWQLRHWLEFVYEHLAHLLLKSQGRQ